MILAVGLLSALGSQTPFGRLLYLIPGVSSERLLNRNLLLVDFSLAVLLAWWIHLLLAERDRPPGSGTGADLGPAAGGARGGGPRWWSPASRWR